MKKTIALLLAVLMILSMVACAANTPAKTEEPATTQTETTTPDTTETEEPAATEEPATEEHEPATLEVFLAQVDWAEHGMSSKPASKSSIRGSASSTSVSAPMQTSCSSVWRPTTCPTPSSSTTAS